MKNILVVDDSTAIRHAIRRILESCGHVVVEARNGAEALDLCRNGLQVDVIFLDVDMPVMTGLEFLTEVQHEVAEPRPPIVMCTTHSSFEMITAALDAGATDYIMKPFDASIVESKLAGLRAA